MLLTERERTYATTAIVTAVGVGALYLFFNRRKIFGRFTDPLYGQKVQIVTSAEECRNLVGILRSHCREFQVLGFDCEWVNESGIQYPVGLLQLASHRGLCALIRLCELKHIPPELCALLNDPTILKVGVASIEDAKLLNKDYKVKVESALDIRYLAEKCNISPPYGMGRLAENCLGVKLDKHWRVRASNWNAPELSERQIKYAANDAHISLALFIKFAKMIIPCRLWTNRTTWCQKLLSEFDCFLDLKYIDKIYAAKANSKKRGKKKLLEAISPHELKRKMSTRASPLYDNCELQAPDGELLCTCDRKKAEWYVLKNLGEIVPDKKKYIVRLNFEPKARAEGDAGKYYLTPKENKCVVCGLKDSYVRKNVVPREYRRYFPNALKEHTSHDVLLLCVVCHRKSNIEDEAMRLKLASICSAPASVRENPKEIRVESIAILRKAARPLVYSIEHLPPDRQEILRRQIQKCLPKGTEITPELLEHYANLSVCIPNENFQAHGEKVVDYFKQQPGGLRELEKMWREHFLRTMKPKHMPPLWSADHTFRWLAIKVREGRLSEEDRVVAGIPLSVCDSSPSSNEGTVSTESYNGNSTSSGTYSRYRTKGKTYSDSTTKDVSSYHDEAVEPVATGSYSKEDGTAFFSNRDSLDTIYGFATEGSSSTNSTTLDKITSDQFKTLVQSENSTGAENDISENGTAKDFASLDVSYDSDDSDSTLSQPSMTLLNSTDDWEAEANEPSVNGTVSLEAKDNVL